MIKNYLKSALRFIKHNKAFAGINLAGLSIALAAAFIILLYVINELSFDTCHKNRHDIYRVLNYYSEFKQTMAGTPFVLASTLKNDFPQVKAATNTRSAMIKLKIGEEDVTIRAIASTSDIFSIFTIPVTQGMRDNILDDPNSIVISREMAEKYFPGNDPVGKEVSGSVNNIETVFIISGVFENLPANSTFRADCLVNNRLTLDPINKSFKVTNADVNWTFDFWNTWILLTEGASPSEIEKQFEDFTKRHISEKPMNSYSLQNLNDVYLRSESVANTGVEGNMKNIRLFSLIAFLIVLVAAINYIILSTAVSVSRSREIGIRKTFGADRRNIKGQLLSESVIITLLVLPVVIILAKISLPLAGRLFQAKLSIIPTNVPLYILSYIGVTLIIGFFSGLYTSSYLSSIKVMDILRNTLRSGKKRQLLRSGLIAVQLIIFCTFVASTLIIRSQYKYALNKETGYYTHGIIMVDMGRDFQGYSAFIGNLRSNPNIIMAAGVMSPLPMTGWMTTMYPSFENPENKVKVEGFAVDYDFISTMGIRLLQGREFSRDFGSDLKKSCIVNETAIKALGIKDPLNQKIGTLNIIGVVKDFNLHSIHTEIPPLSITMTDRYIQQVAIRYKPGTLNSILPVVEAEWKSAAPDRPFRYFTIESL
ncbi:MAG TPA: ABC transporter permease, partial [Bacteroidales bacterium]|nr:ABC transporter permease [Bacteroidales bacterium]